MPFRRITTDAREVLVEDHGPPSQPPIAAIIPAYNEAGWINGVLDVLRQVNCLTEIIVVDDSSTDATADEVTLAAYSDNRIKVITHPTNLGKGQAIYSGWRSTQAPYLLLLDADLINLTPTHVINLIQPVLDGQADMTVGLFRGGHLYTDMSHIISPWLTGQRCLRSDLLRFVSTTAAEGYGFETALTVAAHQFGWRINRVILKGVWHIPSEVHRGFLLGMKTHLIIYTQIINAWRLAGGWKVIVPHLGRRQRLLLLILAVLVGSSLVYNRSMARSSLNINELQTIPISERHRLLIIAPHPDDETLGAGGAIQTAIAQGMEVRVVIVTNGDGQRFAPLAFNHRLLTKPTDYITDGERRQAESLAALSRLGVSAQDVYFLGYPDGGLTTLWLADWKTSCPMRGLRTRVTHSPYLDTYNRKAIYCGSDIVDDLQTIIINYQPDLIIIPHPNDEHPDHRTTSNFSQLAIALQIAANPNYHPAVYGYLIHFGYYPRPRGLYTNRLLLPPSPLSGPGNDWYRLDLTPQEVQVKLAAVREYHTQEFLLGKFLPSFVRCDEIYASISMLDLSPLALKSFPLNKNGIIQLPKLPEPASESVRRFLVGGADLVGWQVIRLGDNLWLTAETRGHLLPGLHYRILSKTPDGDTRVVSYATNSSIFGGKSFTAQLNLSEIGNPLVIIFAADVQQEVTLDRTSWHIIILREN